MQAKLSVRPLFLILTLIPLAVLLPALVSATDLTWTCEDPDPANSFSCKVQTNSSLNFVPSTAESPDGSLWLVWQSVPADITRPPTILLKKYFPQNATWSFDRNVTVTCSNVATCGDMGPDIIRLANNSMLVVWSRQVSRIDKGDLYYKLNFQGSWSQEYRLTSGLTIDSAVAVLQDRRGWVWVVWQRQNATEPVVYDDNSNGVYDSGEPIIAAATGQSPDFGASLKDDPKIRYRDDNNNDAWASGEAVVYDSNSNGLYEVGELVITGTAPSAEALLKDDPKVKYVDVDGNNVRDINPTQLFYKFYDGTNWSQEFQLTFYQVLSGGIATSDQLPSIMEGNDGRIWVVWSSSRSDQQDLYYKTFDLVAWSPNTQVFNDTEGYLDEDPDIIQDRDGTIRIFWSRRIPSVPGSLCGTLCGEIFTLRSIDNGLTWSARETLLDPLLFPNNAHDGGPAVAEFSDFRMRVFWIQSPTTGVQSFDILYQKSNPIFTHDAATVSITGPSPSAAEWNDTFQVTVAVVNEGDFDETATVNLIIGTTTLATTNVFLQIAELETITFTVRYNNTTQLPPGRPLISASVTIAQESIGNSPDNTRADGILVLFAPGDVNVDGSVDIIDAAIWIQSLGATPDSPSWRPEADLNSDGIVDMQDALIIALWVDTRI